MMSQVKDCGDFVEFWNERLDGRAGGLSAISEALADHTDRCEVCRCRQRIFLELESGPASWSTPPAPSEAVVGRWKLAATSTRAIPFRAAASARSARCWNVGDVAKWGLVGSVAALVLVCVPASLPILFPIESAPIGLVLAQVSAPRLEEAIAEARSVTLELAREVSGPAARIGSEALKWGDERSIVPSRTTLADLGESAIEAVPSPRPATPIRSDEKAGIERISGSARRAFGFLIGSALDDPADSEPAEGL